MKRYIISVDQSTQGTKALLFDGEGTLLLRRDAPHAQLVNEQGWVSHDGEEIFQNTLRVIRAVVEDSGIDKDAVAGLALTNQRETSLLWDRETGEPLAHAIVWQCARAAEICRRPEIAGFEDEIFRRTGMKLSPYFPAAKIAWLLEHTDTAGRAICHGTVDSWLVFRLTGGKSCLTDYSNASRTQLFNIFELKWDEEICRRFGIDPANLPEVTDSNGLYGYTDCGGLFDEPIPIRAVMGDSHAALFGQNCRAVGMTKATYGTGSSIMMNIGTTPALSASGVVTSLAWGVDGRVEYVLEGNLNYTGAVITWLKNDMGMIGSPAETEELARRARENDRLYLVPAFTGLGAPYWDSDARASVVGMDRTTGRAEFVRAGLECIAYQIADVVFAMERDSGLAVEELRTDGGPTGNGLLMQFQSDLLQRQVRVSRTEELSAVGAAYMAGMALGLWGDEVFARNAAVTYVPVMEAGLREKKYRGWRQAVNSVLTAPDDQKH